MVESLGELWTGLNFEDTQGELLWQNSVYVINFIPQGTILVTSQNLLPLVVFFDCCELCTSLHPLFVFPVMGTHPKPTNSGHQFCCRLHLR